MANKKKLVYTGNKIVRRPKVMGVVDDLILNEKSAKEITHILKEQYNIDISYNCVRAYLKNYSQHLTIEEQTRLNHIFKVLI